MNERKTVCGSGAAEYMRMDRQGHAFQGMAVWKDLLFQLFDTGICAVYDLLSRAPEPLAVFPLGSHNDGVPDKNYKNHCNQCMFSDIIPEGGEIPLLYVTSGSGTGYDEDGFFYRCSVERITLTRDSGGRIRGGSAETVQTVGYLPGGELPEGVEEPAWGCPAWFPDTREGLIYVFSARYRTTKDYLHLYSENRYKVTAFRLPDPAAGGFVRLGAEDILSQKIYPYDIIFTQGGLYEDGKIFYTFGAGHDPYPNGLRVFDLRSGGISAGIDLTGSVFAAEEPEACVFWRGGLYVNTNTKPRGGLFYVCAENEIKR
ncbi:MAG: hypothetical protein ILO42_06135 [Clostridia bacterium]|nr:hypothetical protein [Clostridia bacterium]